MVENDALTVEFKNCMDKKNQLLDTKRKTEDMIIQSQQKKFRIRKLD